MSNENYTEVMRFASIRKFDISNGEGIGVALFTQGCFIHCYNCFNSETWDFDGGSPYTQNEEDQIIKLLKPSHIVRLTILGGEPLIERNREPLSRLIQRVHETYPDKKIWIYTGQTFDTVHDKFPEIVDNVNVLVDGPYIDKLRNHDLKWCGSSNQRVIDIEDTLASGCIHLHPNA